ncbi:MAG: YHS domain protein [Flammeovirgaceae bacterium]|jgi:YHS domain-containing protein|nr:YHS domain protein [Flammeovirgaceae bacterium]
MKANLLSLAFLFLSIIAFAQTDDARKKNFNIKKNVAIEGYDPVSYFDNKPAEGKSQFSFALRGVTYWFSSQANLNKFKASPEKYEPAYGGWCAYAMGETGEKVKIDPETFKILDGKLYLFYNFWGTNTLKDWNKNEKTLKTKGDQNWKKLLP